MPTYYGYMLDAEKLVRFALQSDTRLREQARQQGLEACAGVLMSNAVSWVERQAAMPGLAIKVVRLDDGRIGGLWTLPPTVHPKYRTKEDARKLCAFKKLIGADGEPLEAASAQSLKSKQIQPPQSFTGQTYSTFMKHVRAGEITLDELLEPLGDLPDTERLSLTEGDQGSESRDVRYDYSIS